MTFTRQQKNWLYTGLAVSLALSIILFAYAQTTRYLYDIWIDFSDGEYAHGFLVLAISVYIIWVSRETLSKITPEVSFIAVPALIASSLLWTVSVLVDINVAQAFSLVMVIASVMWLLTGNRAFKHLWFPVLFMLFAIPMWFPLSPWLQDITADAVFAIVRLMRIPAYREENLIIVPAGTLSIEEACSGLRYLLAALTLGTLYAFLNYRTTTSRLLVVLIAAAAAVVTNFFRVLVVVYLGYATDMQHPLVHDHLSLGWYIFAGLVLILLVIDSRINRFVSDDEGGRDEAVDSGGNTKMSSIIIALLVAASVILSGPVLVNTIHHSGDYGRDIEIVMPDVDSGWDRQDGVTDNWQPLFHGAVNYNARYDKDGKAVSLYVGYYPGQKQGQELINDTNMINNKRVWKTQYVRARIKQVDGEQVLEQKLQDASGQQRLVWYWYNVAGISTINRYEAKLLQVMGLLTSETSAYVVAVTSLSDGSDKMKRELLRQYVRDMRIPLDAVSHSIVTRTEKGNSD